MNREEVLICPREKAPATRIAFFHHALVDELHVRSRHVVVVTGGAAEVRKVTAQRVSMYHDTNTYRSRRANQPRGAAPDLSAVRPFRASANLPAPVYIGARPQK